MVVGRHIAGNFYRVASMPAPREALRHVLKAVELAGARVYDSKLYEFGDGYSILVLVLESHIAVHTWYEPRHVTVDIYTCGAHTDPTKAYDYLVSVFKPERVETWRMDRSS